MERTLTEQEVTRLVKDLRDVQESAALVKDSAREYVAGDEGHALNTIIGVTERMLRAFTEPREYR